MRRFSAAIYCSVALVTTTLLSYFTYFFGAYPVFYGQSLKSLPIYSVETEEKKVAISFDCAWGVDYTDGLLACMEEYKVCSTFFCVEFWTTKYPEYIKKIFDSGHEIGTHSATHSHMSKMSVEDIKRELTSSTKAIEDITGKKVEIFRAPFGEYDNELIDTSREMGLEVIQWDVDSLDWKNISAAEISARVLKKVTNGSIVLFHNNGLHTLKALPLIISTLLDRGYKFVTISDLIYKTNYGIDSNGRQFSHQG